MDSPSGDSRGSRSSRSGKMKDFDRQMQSARKDIDLKLQTSNSIKLLIFTFKVMLFEDCSFKTGSA